MIDESSVIVATVSSHSFEMEIEEETPITTEEEPSVEPKGYLARDEYTSERFKLELNNLPKYFGFGVSEKSMEFSCSVNRCLIRI